MNSKIQTEAEIDFKIQKGAEMDFKIQKIDQILLKEGGITLKSIRLAPMYISRLCLISLPKVASAP